jgi:hypothetical protein
MLNSIDYYQSTVKHFIRYLRSIKDMEIRYKPENPNLVDYIDADYGGDKLDRKSITGNVFLLTEEAISWLSRKQKSVLIFITEAEYIAASTYVKQGVWLA